MAEEGLAAPEGEQTPAPEEGLAAPSIVDEHGNFTPTWREALPEAIRDEPSLKTVTTVGGLAKSFVDTKKMVGMDKIAVPNENSTEADWDAFYVAAGRPITAADYNFQRPADYPEELYSQDLAVEAQDLFHKIGLNQTQANALLAWNLEKSLKARTTAQTDYDAMQQEVESGLYAKWGNAKAQKMHLGKIAVEQGTEGDVELQERLTGKFFNDPDFIEFAANVGGKFAEHSPVEAVMIPTPADIDEQIAELMKTAAYRGGHGISAAEHTAMVNKVYALRQSKTVKRTA